MGEFLLISLVYFSWSVVHLDTSLEPRLSVPDFVSQLWRKIGSCETKSEPGFEAILTHKHQSRLYVYTQVALYLDLLQT